MNALGFQCLTVRVVSVDAKQHLKKNFRLNLKKWRGPLALR